MKPLHPGRSGGLLAAFSLLELLVVVGLMVFILSFTVPAINGVMEGGRLTQSATILANQLAIAQLRAVGGNRPVLLRFIRPDASSPYDRIQLITTDPQGNATPVDRVKQLATGTAIARSTSLSSLLGANPETQATAADPPVPELGTNYRYVQFSFRPRGSLDLDVTRKWFVTLVYQRDEQKSEAPDNFITLQVDPANGTVVAYQP